MSLNPVAKESLKALSNALNPQEARHLGCYPGLLQGLLQHQRGHHLHHVQLDRPLPRQ